MAEQQHPITPPQELVQQWVSLACEYEGNETWIDLATQAARWGADAELEACCKALEDIWDRTYHDMTIADILHELRSMRRPKPPSLAEQALGLLVEGPVSELLDHEVATIRAALTRLQELENNG